MTAINSGNIGSKEQAEKIQSKLQGQSWMNFQVIICSMQNNVRAVGAVRIKNDKLN